MSDEYEDVEYEDVEYGLVMPFVVVASKGGPYQDDAYVAGWEAGALDMALSVALSAIPVPRRMVFPMPFHVANRDQIDLIAMKHGMVAEFSDIDEVWASLAMRGSP